MSANQTAPVLERRGGVETAARPVPPLNTLYFYLTGGCNLRCRHCWIEPPHQTAKRQYPAVEPELFRHILEQAKPLGLSSVKLTGGEPLMHPRIGEILEILREEKIRFNMETNGVLCTPELARELARSGLYHISVSLDGADAGTHEWVRGVKGCFDAAVAGIRNLVATGIRPQLIMTLMRRNVEQIEAVVRLAESLGASSVKFNLVQPTARGEKMHEKGETLGVEELIALGKWVENDLARTAKVRLFYGHPVAFRALGRLFSPDGDCGICGIRHILGVLAGGSYALCGIGESVPELVFGHAAKDDLSGVWKDSPVLNEIRDGMPRRLEGVCGECLMKGVCLGSCIAQNYYRSRNLWAPFWFCEEARSEGLFPETRIRRNEAVAADSAAAA
ncbi:MAG: SynChlorMet cassette radical SAM/SPASM protein ScmF [Syntrophobacterales bacterium]|nr:SynChlorMet cassette radical SAM/SPASM protein ScmF [Syntrophobacterales bacterium]